MAQAERLCQGAMMLASHFHDEIVRHGLTALPILLIGAAILVVAWGSIDRRRRRIWSLLSTGILVAGLGGYRLAEAEAMSHNHLCHAHHAGDCHRHADDHTHWFGGRTATPRGDQMAERHLRSVSAGEKQAR